MIVTPADFSSLIEAELSAFSSTKNFVFRGDEWVLRKETFALPVNSELERFGDLQFHPFGVHQGALCRVAALAQSAEAPAGFFFSKMRPLWGFVSLEQLALAGRAFQIIDWARTHQFCGACGSKMALLEGERCYRCTQCKFMAYPRISPAMMVLVRKGDSILLARHAAAVGNRFTALAGFAEAGESIEDTIHREVMEEVGLKVKDLRYFGSQAWPFPHSLMLAFTAEYESGEIRVDTKEIAEAKWYGPGDVLPEYLRGVSISGELITANLPRAS